MILRTSSGPIYYEMSGEGPPLVFVSGWAMSCECWRAVVAILKRSYRCLIYDSRGIGQSQPVSLAARFDIDDHADDLHALLTAEAIFDATIIGHEIGSLVAAACALYHPQDIRSLALVSPRTAVSQSELKRLSVFTPAAIALRELAIFPLIRNVIAWRFRRAPQPYRDKLFEDFAELNPRAAYETALSATNPDALARLVRTLENKDSQTLVISGAKDKKGLSEARSLFHHARAGKLAIVKDAGFLPMLEYPRQFARLLDDFAAGSRRAPRQAISRI